MDDEIKIFVTSVVEEPDCDITIDVVVTDARLKVVQNLVCLVEIHLVLGVDDAWVLIVDVICVEDDSSATMIEVSTCGMVDIDIEAVKIVNDEFL